MRPLSPSSPGIDDVSRAIAAGPGPDVVLLSPRASARKIAEAMIALANAHGGLIVLGVTAGRKIIGCEDAREACQRMSDAAFLTSPPLWLRQPDRVQIDDHTLCVAQVPAGATDVYSLRGRYLVRSGRINRPLTPPELRSLLFERGEAGFELQTPPGATLDDLDADALHIYRDLLSLGPEADVHDLLIDRGCLKTSGQDVVPTHAGLLLFGRKPQHWLPSAEITAIRYVGTAMSDDFVREDIRGALPAQIRRAEAFVAANMRRGARFGDPDRESVSEYPLAAVREAIVNAVAHRDYSLRGDTIRLLMFSDRLEIISPGRLPGPLTPKNLSRERFSRNPILAKTLTELGFMQSVGYGIGHMLAVCEQEGWRAPEFVETAVGFKVTLHSYGPELVGAGPPPNLFSHLQLTSRQEKVLAFLQTHPRITSRDLQTLCPEASPNTLRRDLSALVDKGLLLRIGQKRATYYILK